MQRTRQSLVAIIAVLFLVFAQLAAAQVPAAATPSAADTQQQAPVTRATPAPQTTPGNDNPEVTVAARLASAHNLYVQDVPADAAFPTTRGDGYTAFVAEMQSWGRFTLVSSANLADVVLQFHAGINPPDAQHKQGTPYFRLTFADPVALAPLWIVTVPVNYGKHGKADLFEQSVVGLTAQVQMLTGLPLNAAQQAAVATPANWPHHRSGRVVGGVVIGAVVTLSVVLPIVTLNHMKSDQDAFCKANNIPLNECAGG